MVTSELSSKKRVRKSFSRSPQFLMEPSGSFMNHSKASPFRVPMNKRAKIASFCYCISCLRLEIVYVLVR